MKPFFKASILATALVTREWNNNWDYKASLPIPATQIKRHVFLIRHGQYVTNDPKLKEIDNDIEEFNHNDPLRPLTKLGRTQAGLTGDKLASILNHEAFFSKNGEAI